MNRSGSRASRDGSASNRGAAPFNFPSWTHCNVCKAFPIRGGQGEGDGETVSFVVSNCGHVFCGSCGDALQSSTCPFCHVQVSLLPINENMPAEAKSFFQAGTSLKKSVQYSKSLNRHLENFTRVRQYEQNQVAYLMNSALQQVRIRSSLIRTRYFIQFLLLFSETQSWFARGGKEAFGGINRNLAQR